MVHSLEKRGRTKEGSVGEGGCADPLCLVLMCVHVCVWAFEVGP